MVASEAVIRIHPGWPASLRKGSMTRESVIEAMEEGRVVAILRGDFGGRELDIARVLLEEGIRALEVTLNSPGALGAIERLSALMEGRMAVGAGTVLHPEEVEAAARVGTRFIVSPDRNVRVIEKTRELGLVSIPGCLTPSEIREALSAGADAVKIFPAQVVGPAFVKAIRGPLPHVPLVPTGGVTPEAAAAYLQAGAWAVAVGSELLRPESLQEQGIEGLRARARLYRETVLQARGGRGA